MLELREGKVKEEYHPLELDLIYDGIIDNDYVNIPDIGFDFWYNGQNRKSNIRVHSDSFLYIAGTAIKIFHTTNCKLYKVYSKTITLDDGSLCHVIRWEGNNNVNSYGVNLIWEAILYDDSTMELLLIQDGERTGECSYHNVNSGWTTVEFELNKSYVFIPTKTEVNANKGKSYIMTEGSYDVVYYLYDTNQHIITTEYSQLQNLLNIYKVEIVCEEPEQTKIRFAISKDNRVTWLVFDSDSDEWVTVEGTDEEIIERGMTKEQFMAITKEQFDLLYSDLDVHLNIDTYIVMRTDIETITPSISSINYLSKLLEDPTSQGHIPVIAIKSEYNNRIEVYKDSEGVNLVDFIEVNDVEDDNETLLREVIVEGVVDYTQVNSYPITFKVIDSHGNRGQLQTYCHVVEHPAQDLPFSPPEEEEVVDQEQENI